MTAPVAIPFFTGNGHTRALAEAVADGSGHGAGRRAVTLDVESLSDRGWATLDAAPAILFACPTYMGSVPARYEAFLEDASDRWMDQGWADKLAGGMSVATFPSGDKLATLIRLSIFAAQMGMVWIGPNEIGAPVDPENPGINAGGSWLGLTATSSRDKSLLISKQDRETARRFGARVARAVARWG